MSTEVQNRSSGLLVLHYHLSVITLTESEKFVSFALPLITLTGNEKFVRFALFLITLTGTNYYCIKLKLLLSYNAFIPMTTATWSSRWMICGIFHVLGYRDLTV